MSNSSSIVKSGSSDIVGQSRSIGDLRLHDDNTEITSITPEQIQSLRNGLSTSVTLTKQVVDVIGGGDSKFKRDVKKINDLKRRLKRVFPTGSDTTGLGQLISKPIGKVTNKAAPNLLGALLLEGGAGLLDNIESAKRSSLLGGWRRRQLPFRKKIKPTGVKNYTNKKRFVKAKRFFDRKITTPIKRRFNSIKSKLFPPKKKPLLKSNTLKGKGIVPKTSIVDGKIQSSSAKAPSIPKSKLIPKPKPKPSGINKFLKKAKLGTKANIALTIGFAGWEFSDRKKNDQTNLQAGAGTASGVAGGIAGASTGAWIGAGIGSSVPIVGTAIGGIVGGLIGGIAGSMYASKVSDDITGVNKKDESKIEPIQKDTNVSSLNKDTSRVKDTIIYITDKEL